MATKKAEDLVPAEFTVGPYRYSVSFDGEASYDYGYLGVCLYRSKRIKLDPRQADTELPQTFIHEVLHALGNAHEIKYWSHHTTDNEHKLTDQIDLMASAILQFIRGNPQVVKYLQESA